MERGTATARKVMVVAEPGRESAGALQWALSHAILKNDELILLHVQNPASWRTSFSTFLKRPASHVAALATEAIGELEFLEEMKNLCEAAQPKVRVHIEKVEMEGKDKATTILFQTMVHSIDLLVIGQRRSLSTALLGRSGGSTRGTDTAEYLIENSKCTCVGVQKKGQNAGYLLNTKTHKNFWLLA
ncbi:hypothetical protein HHK36_020430 [Tetracentron sinense]|uniref:UspA domain-containing protein n=1 Tax=Tetracentron sinense TaxID=13715 RepID=A0A834YXP2_TETSI|nr:hypothetical protein HHK36_020430 [Tetracentron sinense]